MEKPAPAPGGGVVVGRERGAYWVAVGELLLQVPGDADAAVARRVGRDRVAAVHGEASDEVARPPQRPETAHSLTGDLALDREVTARCVRFVGLAVDRVVLLVATRDRQGVSHLAFAHLE